MNADIEEIRQRADIVEIVGQYVELRPVGNDRFKACCPFHDEKTPSFNVSRDKGFYKCFGCGEGGDVFKFLQKIENITFREALERLAQRYGVELQNNPEAAAQNTERQLHHQILGAANSFFQAQFNGDHGWPAQDYASSRGLAKSTLAKFGIGYAPDSWDDLRNHLQRKHQFELADIAKAGLLIERERTENVSYYDRFRHRLMFPIWDASGRVIAFGGRILSDAHTDQGQAKYINSPEGPLFHKSTVLYAFHLARGEVSKSGTLIITEGYMDAIALHEAGFGNTVATLGTALTAQHITLLRRLSPQIVYLCFDGDSAGMKAALRSAPLFAAHNLDVRVIALPAEDDPDTFVKRNGAPAFDAAIKEAKLLAQYRLEQAVVPFDWAILAERKNAVRAGAQVIAEAPNATERDAYVIWLAQQWARAENVMEPDRLRMLEDAVRSDVRQILRREQRQAQRREEEAPPEPEQEQNILEENAATSVSKGVIGAQKELLGLMINNPSWRQYVAAKMPLEKWTQTEYEPLLKVLLAPDAELLSTTELLEKIPQDQHSLVTTLVMSSTEDAVPTDLIIDDWIARVERHWAKLREKDILKIVQEKLEKGDVVTDEEKSTFLAALRDNKRIRNEEEVEEA